MDNLQKNCHRLESPHSNKQPKCSQCLRYQAIVEQYKGLVDLLNRKIHQLLRKVQTTISPQSSAEVDGKRTQRTYATLKRQFGVELGISQEVNLLLLPTLQQTAKRSFVSQFSQSRQKWGLSSGSMWRQANLVNTLTEQILQLKSNFMHIRQCIYSLFQEVNLWGYVRKSAIGTNMGFVLFNIFEYSQQERQEMCRLRKVKVKKHQLESKENVFVTVKQI